MPEQTRLEIKRKQWIWGAVLIMLWVCVGLLFYQTNGHLSVRELLRYQPDNVLLTAAAMCGLFLLKSGDFLVHSAILYALDGIMFPLPVAIGVNMLGIAIMSAVSYRIGSALGAPALERLREKNPKLRETEGLNTQNTFMLTVLLRSIGVPVNIASLYMGARSFPFLTYMIASEIGLLPIMIPYTLMGDSASDIHSPVFIGSVAARILVAVCAALVYRGMRRKAKSE